MIPPVMSSSNNGRSLTQTRLNTSSNPRNHISDNDGSLGESPLELNPRSPIGPPPPRSYSPSPCHTPDHTHPPTSDSQSGLLLGVPRTGTFLNDSRGSSYSSGFVYGDNSRIPSRAGSLCSEEALNTETVAQKFAIVPDEILGLNPEHTENDDWLHNPDPNESDRDYNFCTPRGLLNVGGLFLLILGVLTLFIGYPLLTFVDRQGEPESENPCYGDPMCLDVGDVPLLKNIRSGLIDPDTPKSAMKIKSAEGTQWELVYSDEFNKDGRSFFPGDDPYLLAVDIWYGVTQDLEWYDPDAVTTKDGVLEIRFDAFQNHDLNYRSGMVQSWNKLCFTGGRLEASISLPGRGDTSGLWPGFWSMGNLGRPGYAATTEGLWPYSYSDVCDAGITPNQSSPDGLSSLPGMRLPACTCKGEDHPTQGKSRSAPEMDVLEMTVHAIDNKVPPTIVGDVSQSCQIAPFDIWYMPNYEFSEVYDSRVTSINSYRGGPLQQAISGVTNLNNDWYEDKKYQVYALEYEPGADGYVTWFVGPKATWKLDGRALAPNGNVGQRVVPTEPMTVTMNLGMSDSFTSLNMTGMERLFPARMRFDYIRIYQDPDNKSVTCDPVGMETTEYIKRHEEAYNNQNLMRWEDTGFDWPQNTLMHGCS